MNFLFRIISKRVFCVSIYFLQNSDYYIYVKYLAYKTVKYKQVYTGFLRHCEMCHAEEVLKIVVAHFAVL